MSKVITITTLVAAITLLAPCGKANAQVKRSEDQALYVGANIGLLSDYKLDCNAGDSCERRGKLSGKVYIGQNFELMGGFGLEAMAFSIGSAKGSLQRNAGREAGSLKEIGVGLYAVMPLNYGDFGVKAKLGAGYVRGLASYAAGGSDSKWSVQPLVGLSASYAISKQVGVQLDWDSMSAKYGAGSSRVNMISAGVSFKF